MAAAAAAATAAAAAAAAKPKPALKPHAAAAAAGDNAIVIDVGSGVCKGGFAGDDAPRSVFPTVVGYPHDAMGSGDAYVGDEAIAKRGVVATLRSPVVAGTVVNWDDMEKLLHYTFGELKTTPDEHPVLMTSPPQAPRSHRERLAQTLFETLDVPAVCVASSGVLALLAGGRTTGVVLECGHNTSATTVVYKGFALPHATQRSSLGGADITRALVTMLGARGFNMSGPAEVETVRDIKEKLGRVSLERLDDEEAAAEEEHTYELPDGNKIIVGNETTRCAEALFQPLLAGLACSGLHDLVSASVAACPLDARKELLSNVVLAGGSTLFTGLDDRLTREVPGATVDALLWSSGTFLVPPDRKYSVWIGGSMFAALSASTQCFASKAEYDECGPSIIDRKGWAL